MISPNELRQDDFSSTRAILSVIYRLLKRISKERSHKTNGIKDACLVFCEEISSNRDTNLWSGVNQEEKVIFQADKVQFTMLCNYFTLNHFDCTLACNRIID